jgi:FlaA1/EpsC-like NDP-sugar epimerase
VTTNISGTRNVAEAAARLPSERFVLVSTDKAVNPISVMGATKRLAEVVVSSIANGTGTVFSSVRFGNVFASRGSVIPIFAQQVRDGGPITVTHPDATRYFMTIPEAVSLICQAASLGQGGETFVLEMGEPVRIMDLADRMRNLMAAESGQDVEIVVTGLRPGEKIHEDLWTKDETLIPVKPGILLSKPQVAMNGVSEEVDERIRHLEALAEDQADRDAIIEELFGIVGCMTKKEVAATHDKVEHTAGD